MSAVSEPKPGKPSEDWIGEPLGKPTKPVAARSRECLKQILRYPGRFALQVLGAFTRNQGLLLSGAVAYYMLLSIIPLGYEWALYDLSRTSLYLLGMVG
jgi:hypothetical protein